MASAMVSGSDVAVLVAELTIHLFLVAAPSDVEEFRPYQPGGNLGDPDARPRQVETNVHGHLVDRRLGGAVSGADVARVVPTDRAQVDDVAAVPFDHARQHRAQDMQDCAEVDVDHGVHLGDIDRHQAFHADAEARIVDDDIDVEAGQLLADGRGVGQVEDDRSASGLVGEAPQAILPPGNRVGRPIRARRGARVTATPIPLDAPVTRAVW